MKEKLKVLKESGAITEFAEFAILEFLEKSLVEETLATKYPGKEWKEISQKEQNAMDNYNRAIKDIRKIWTT